MSNAIRCINKRNVFRNSGTLCLAFIFNLRLSRPRKTSMLQKKMVKGF